MHRFRFGVAMVAAALLAAISGPALAEDGVTADTIVFGQAAVLEGPASALGQGMKAGLSAAFEEVNKKGGVHGRKLKLISENDGYEPDKSIERWSHFLRQPAKVDSPMRRTIHHEDAETVFG